jgi:hypothetical protein
MAVSFLYVTGFVKAHKCGSVETLIFSILLGRDNRAMHNDYVLKHIFDERSQTQCCGIPRFDSDAAVGRFLPVEIFFHIVNIIGRMKT